MPFTDSSFPTGTGSRGTPQALPLRPSALKARNGALSQPLAFELAQRGEDCELEPPAGGAEVQTFLQRHERNVQGLKILEHCQEVFQIPPDPIESPADDDLNLARRASSSSRSRPGRRSFAPLISSVYSA